MKERILGRVALEDVRDPFTGEVMAKGTTKSMKRCQTGLKTRN